MTSTLRRRRENSARSSTILRTGLLVPSMPDISSTFPALPPQPSWRIRAMISRSGRSLRGACVSDSMRSFPHRSQVILMNHDGKALNGSASASAGVGERVSPVPSMPVSQLDQVRRHLGNLRDAEAVRHREPLRRLATHWWSTV